VGTQKAETRNFCQAVRGLPDNRVTLVRLKRAKAGLLFGAAWRFLFFQASLLKSLGRSLSEIANTSLMTLCHPQAWFSTGFANPVRDLMRDLERESRAYERTNFSIRIDAYV